MQPEPPDTTFYLLRGLAREIRHWQSFPEKLEMESDHFKVVALEIPGAGQLRHDKAPLNVKEYVELIRKQYLGYAQSTSRNIVIGLSFGGMIAACWIDAYPKDFQAAVFINSSCNTNISCNSSRIYKRMRPRAAWTLILSALLRNPYKKEKMIAALICNLADPGEIAKKWQEIQKSAPVSTINTLRQIYAAATFSLPPKPSTPALILCSSHDRLVSHTCSEVFARQWQTELLCHDDAGHDLPTDDPDWCVANLRRWLEQKNIT